MWWQYLLVFLGALLFDIVPLPFAPAFTIMVFLQILFDLNVWTVTIIGVAGSVLGRYILLLYTPLMANKFLKTSKNEDIKFLGDKMNENKWKGISVVLAYSLLPLPTTPLFLGAGISQIKPIYIIPPFLIGKFTSDAVALHVGKFAFENHQSIIDNIFSWQSIGSFILGFVMLFCLFFINWRTLIQTKKLAFDFKIFN
ncbi:MAG: membrane protein YqaA with SNARE-associated domain [Flavobacteriales bacterium]|jgi:membrane protein YqaA with SNARE-associated domain